MTTDARSLVNLVCIIMKPHLLALLQDNCLDLVRCAFLRKLSGCVRNITAFCLLLLRPIISAVLADADIYRQNRYISLSLQSRTKGKGHKITREHSKNRLLWVAVYLKAFNRNDTCIQFIKSNYYYAQSNCLHHWFPTFLWPCTPYPFDRVPPTHFDRWACTSKLEMYLTISIW